MRIIGKGGGRGEEWVWMKRRSLGGRTRRRSGRRLWLTWIFPPAQPQLPAREDASTIIIDRKKVIFAKFLSQVPQVGWQTQLGTNFYTLYKPRGERASGFSAGVPFSIQVFWNKKYSEMKLNQKIKLMLLTINAVGLKVKSFTFLVFKERATISSKYIKISRFIRKHLPKKTFSCLARMFWPLYLDINILLCVYFLVI